MDIRGLLLCGGLATRFGGAKLLAAIPGEESSGPLAARAARRLREGAGNALAIVPLGARELRAALEAAGCEVIESDRTARGMGASLAAAVAATDRADGWIVALGDMPLVEPATIRAVRDALEDGALIAAPVLAATGRRGHPVGFGAALRAELLDLDADVGARAILDRHADAVRLLPTHDAGIAVDLDTREQLEALRNSHSRDKT
ncbi:MAG TPA: NTP transferase domain-containing protein [Usitatibacter sp.]|jgi:molybdenum cofactor cytidylyltransferase|nr:NTP transferase domain-containing protein [Usitatibacter sp.]